VVIITAKERAIMALSQVDNIVVLIPERFPGYYCKNPIIPKNMSAFKISKVGSVNLLLVLLALVI